MYRLRVTRKRSGQIAQPYYRSQGITRTWLDAFPTSFACPTSPKSPHFGRHWKNLINSRFELRRDRLQTKILGVKTEGERTAYSRHKERLKRQRGGSQFWLWYEVIARNPRIMIGLDTSRCAPEELSTFKAETTILAFVLNGFQ